MENKITKLKSRISILESRCDKNYKCSGVLKKLNRKLNKLQK